MNAKLADKIAKIQRLIAGAKTPGEAFSASAALSRLVAKHGLSAVEVAECFEDVRDNPKAICREFDLTRMGRKRGYAYNFISAYCQEYFKCKGSIRYIRETVTKLFIYGIQSDVEIFEATLDSLVSAALHLFKDSGERSAKSYILGFADGAGSAFKAMAESEGYLPALIVPQAVLDIYPKDLTPPKKRRISSNYTYFKGMRDGRDVVSKDKIGAAS